MEARLRKVEEAVIEIRTTLPHLATKLDLARLGHRLTIGLIIVAALSPGGLALLSKLASIVAP